MQAICSFAGSDPSGLAGIQADLKTFSAFRFHGTNVITAITAQNSQHLSAVEVASPALIREQWNRIQEEFEIMAVKTGMLKDTATLQAVADCLRNFKGPIIVDPILSTSSGSKLSDAIDSYHEFLFPLAHFITPNLIEAPPIKGALPIVLKGGHSKSSTVTDRFGSFSMETLRIPGPNIRGTGCTFASALAAASVNEFDRESSLIVTKAFMQRGIRKANQNIFSYADWMTGYLASDFPSIGKLLPGFPSMDRKTLQIYPIIDRAHKIRKFAGQGIQTIQLRIKDLVGSELENEIEMGCKLARELEIQLFINDYWDLAHRFGAYGVHLGQEDLKAIDASRDLRLGISTHTPYELAKAFQYQPSYIALGPIFPTNAKQMPFQPQGLERLSLWRQWIDLPLVAIGGITSQQLAQDCWHAGADGISGIRLFPLSEI